MKKTALLLILGALLLTTVQSCVSARKFEEAQKEIDDLRQDKFGLQDTNEKQAAQIEELKAEYDSLYDLYVKSEEARDLLEKDTAIMGASNRKLDRLYHQINEAYETLLKTNKGLISESTAKNKKLLAELNDLKDDLEEKQRQLQDKEITLNKLSEDLSERENKINELEKILNEKEKTVNDLRRTINDALMGFKDNELTVEMKNGKVYVSLQEKLLFASGRFNIDKKGEEALLEIAKVLRDNEDISIMVEGHTDDVPVIPGSKISDNWDLSVLRATEVVRILSEKGNIDAKRLTAAGRSEYVPIVENDSKEAKAKNRRTEIILTPKLDELFQILE